MSAVIYIDGPLGDPGCQCGESCDFPCWQRVGVASPCERCNCDWGPEWEGTSDEGEGGTSDE